MQIEPEQTADLARPLVVPVTLDETATVRRRYPAWWDPAVVFTKWLPVAGVPLIVRVPVPRSPEVFFRRSRCCWAVVKRQRWRVLIDNLIWCGVVEETIHPLVTFGGLIPVTGNPLLTRWNRAPYAAHPKVFAGVFVPPPVARDPNNILAFRLVLRRDLIDRCRRSRRDHDAQGRVLSLIHI